MRLREERLKNPESVRRKISVYHENYYALLIAILKDVTPEEAFLSLYSKRVHKLIRHTKYTTDDIYTMMDLRDKGSKIKEIAKRYKLSVGMVWKILDAYGYKEREGDIEMKYTLILSYKMLTGKNKAFIHKVVFEFGDKEDAVDARLALEKAESNTNNIRLVATEEL